MKESYMNVLKNISKKTGLSIDKIRQMSPREQKLYLEKRNNKKINFVSKFPFIGRGNVLRDGIIDNKDINRQIDKMIGL